MNRFILTTALILSGSILFAQNGAITNAILYHKEGTLDKAKHEIDRAVVHEKTQGEPKAWYYKGVVYLDLSRTQNANYKALAADPLKESIDAFNKAKELDAAKKEYYKLSDEQLKSVWGDVINRGVKEYNGEKLKDALNWFELAHNLNAKDTLGPLYACAAASALGDTSALRRNTNYLVALNYKSADVYKSRISLESDPAKKLELARQGHADYPADRPLAEMLGDLYSQQGKYQEAIAAYQSIIDRDPQQATVLTKIAFQHQKMKDYDKALDVYEKALKINNNNFLGQYNACIVSYEKGRELYEKIHKLNVNEYQSSGKTMEDEMNTAFNKSIAHANTALTLATDETDKKNINFLIGEIKKITKK